MAKTVQRTPATAMHTRPVVPRKDPFTDGSGTAIPIMGPGTTFAELGSAGLRQFGGWVREEFLQQLQGRQAARVYREMADNSPTVGALLFAINQAVRQVEWSTESVNDSAKAVEMAEFADSLRHDMSHTWEDFIIEALSMLIYGFAPHEIVYKRRMGRKDDARGADNATSAYDDGRVGIRKLPVRGQDTVLRWFFGVNGETLGLTQQPWIGPMVDLPIEKLLLFRPGQHKNNPEGRSILRSAYVPYFFVKRLQEQESIMVERFSGLPVLYVPNDLVMAASAKNPDPQALATYNYCKKLVANIRVDEQAGVLLPGDPYFDENGKASGVRKFELQLLSPQSRSSGLDVGAMINRYKLDILSTSLADFITMGHEVRGTNNLASVKVDMFYQAVEGWLDGISSVLNQYLLPRIWRLNAFDPNLMPAFKCTMPQRVDLDGLGGFIGSMATAGMPLFPDQDLENYIREAAGLPDVADPGAYAATAGRPDVLKNVLAASMARRVLHKRGRGEWIKPRVRVRAGSARAA